MATLSRYDKNDPDPFLTEARAQLMISRIRGRRALYRATSSIFFLGLWAGNVFPWVTFVLMLVVGTMAIFDFEAWLVARRGVMLAMQFRAGIQD